MNNEFSDKCLSILLAGEEKPFLKLKGDSTANREKSEIKRYDEAKKPFGSERTFIDKEAARLWVANHKGWYGAMVPPGYILVDIDNPESGELVYKRLKKAGIKFIGIRTPNGYQFLFRDSARIAKQFTMQLTLLGIVCDYRISGKGYIVLPSEETPGRYFLHCDDELDPMPLMFLPVRTFNPEKDSEVLSLPIYDGGRDDILFRHACRIRAWNERHKLGLTSDDILQVLEEINEVFGEPPKSYYIVQQKLKSAERYNVVEKIGTGHCISEACQENESTQHDIAFPDIYTGVAADYTWLISEYLEVPPHFNFMAYLTCIGNLVSDILSLKSSIKPQPRLYTLLLGESADVRKSTAIKCAVQHFQRNLTEFPICWGVGSAEGLQKKLQNKNKLLLCFDEFKQFVSKCRIDGSVLLPCVTTLFENNFYESQTKTTSIELNNVYLSILAASTVETYQTTWDTSFTDIGFTNRLFLVPGEGERKYSVPPDIPEDRTAELWKLSAAVLSFIRANPRIDLEPDAKERFHEWYMNREASIYAKRLDTYALRLMPLFAVIKLQKTVNLDIVEKVIQLMDWQLRMRKIYSPIDADNKMAQIEERIRRNLRMKPLTERELKRNIHADRCGEFYFSHAKANLLRSKDIYYNNTTKKYHLGVSV